MTLPDSVLELILEKMDSLEKQMQEQQKIIRADEEKFKELEDKFQEFADFINPPQRVISISEETGEALTEPTRILSIDEMAKRARQMGMTYGQYSTYLRTGARP